MTRGQLIFIAALVLVAIFVRIGTCPGHAYACLVRQ